MAVIGADAATTPVTSGYGSSRVLPPSPPRPWRPSDGGPGAAPPSSYADGGSTTGPLPPVPSRYLTPASGSGHGLTLTLTQTDPDTTGPVSLHVVQPTVDVSLSPHPSASRLLPTATPPAAPVDRLHNRWPGGPASFR